MAFPVQARRYASLVRRVFGHQGSVFLQAIDDVFLMLPVSGHDDPAMDGLRLEKRKAFGHTVAASVGNLSSSRISNSPGTNKLLVMEEIWVHAGAALHTEFRAGLLTEVGFGASAIPVLDTRFNTGVQATPTDTGAQLVDTFAAASLFGAVPTFAFHVGSEQTFIFRPRAVYLGGFGFLVECQTADAAFDVQFIFTERELVAGEATPG